MDLSVKDLVIEYQSGGYAVRPVDGMGFEAEEGSLSLLLGPSGCGKTSVLSVLSGILTPKSGTVRLGSTEVTALSPGGLSDYRRHQVGIVFQAFNLIASLSALDNVALPLRAAGRSRRQSRERAEELLARVGLAEVSGRRPGAMSGGQQQRVAIARALMLDPPLIVADEPTAHLDYVQVEEVLRLLQELAAAGRIVIVSTHDKRLVPLADQVIELVPEAAVGALPAERFELAAGEVVFRQGSWGELIYVIESGEVEIVGERADGTEDRRAVLPAGKYFGEIGPLCRMPRSATARARTAAVLTGYGPREFRQMLSDTEAQRGPDSRAVAASSAAIAAAVEGKLP